MLFKLPNLITYARILAIPVVVFFLANIQPHHSLAHNQQMTLIAMIVFTIAAISDLVDGYLARKTGTVTLVGKFVDPLADKLLHMAVMIYLVDLEWLPAWMVVVFLFREFLINGLRAVAAGEGVIIDAATWGKRKTAWINCGLGSIILHYPIFVGTSIETNPQIVGMTCLYVGLFYAVISAVQYIKNFIKALNVQN